MTLHEKHAKPAVTSDHGVPADLSDQTLAMMARAVAEQHSAVLELQSLFARRGGILSTHFLKQSMPGEKGLVGEDIFQLEECRSFAVLNFSQVTVFLGFGGKPAREGGGIPIPPGSYLQLPVDTNIARIAAELPALEGVEQALVCFVRFKHLVSLIAGPLANSPPTASKVTATSPRKVATANASAEVIGPNPRRNGLSIVNGGESNVSLGLGAEAVSGDDIVLIPGGSWDGRISGVLWRGAVNAVSAKASSLAVVEI